MDRGSAVSTASFLCLSQVRDVCVTVKPLRLCNQCQLQFFDLNGSIRPGPLVPEGMNTLRAVFSFHSHNARPYSFKWKIIAKEVELPAKRVFWEMDR